MFSPSSTLWRVNRELAVGLAGPRAVLMQIAHPLVAAGVADHSGIRTNRFGRLYRTSMAAATVTFGTEAMAWRVARTINAKHNRVHGRLPNGVGRYRAGTEYDANDPALKVWVMATIVDSALRVYELFVDGLSDGEKQAYYTESLEVAALFGTPVEDFPAGYGDFRDYRDGMLAGDAITVSDQAREIAGALYTPTPTGRVLRWGSGVGIALLPDRLCREFGFEVSASQRERIERRAAKVRAVRSASPSFLFWSPFATLGWALDRARVVTAPDTRSIVRS